MSPDSCGRELYRGARAERLVVDRKRPLQERPIEIEQGFVLVALIFVQLAEAKNFFQHLQIKAFAFRSRQDLFFPLVQRLDLFVEVLDALDE
jgi:hypothetical protein